MSALSLDRLVSIFAEELPAKPDNPLAARSWEAEHGDKKKLLDAITGELRDQARATRRFNQKMKKTTTDAFDVALDSFFAAVKEQIGSRNPTMLFLGTAGTKASLMRQLVESYSVETGSWHSGIGR